MIELLLLHSFCEFLFASGFATEMAQILFSLRKWLVLIFTVGVECGENRGRTGGEPGVPERTGGEPGAFGKRTGGEPGVFGMHLQRVPGEKRGLWDKNRGRTGGREFFLKQP